MEDTEESGFGVIYCRVSTVIQRDEGLSIDFQTKESERWAQRNEIKIRGIYKDEAKTGTKTTDKPIYYIDSKMNPLDPLNYKKGEDDPEYKDEVKLSKIEGISHRQEFKIALKTCKEGDIFICYSLSRLARSLEISLKVYNYLKDKKVFFYVVKDGIDSRNRQSKMQFQMMGIFSEWEGDIIKDRVKSGMELKKERGEVIGKPCYGWMLADGKQSDLIPNPKEQEIIKIIKQLRETKDSNGNPMKFSHIAKELNKKGLKTKENKDWTHVQVIRILEGKCVPKSTKGCKNKKETHNVDSVTNISLNPITNDTIIPVKKEDIMQSANSSILLNDQNMKDYLEFLAFKKMKESLEKK